MFHKWPEFLLKYRNNGTYAKAQVEVVNEIMNDPERRRQSIEWIRSNYLKR
jgi:hypothetical protein